MLVDYTNMINFITQLMYIMAPLSIAFALVSKITIWFIDFVSGNRRVNL